MSLESRSLLGIPRSWLCVAAWGTSLSRGVCFTTQQRYTQRYAGDMQDSFSSHIHRCQGTYHSCRVAPKRFLLPNVSRINVGQAWCPALRKFRYTFSTHIGYVIHTDEAPRMTFIDQTFPIYGISMPLRYVGRTVYLWGRHRTTSWPLFYIAVIFSSGYRQKAILHSGVNHVRSQISIKFSANLIQCIN